VLSPGTTKPNIFALPREKTTSTIRPKTLPSITLTTCLHRSSQKDNSTPTYNIYVTIRHKGTKIYKLQPKIFLTNIPLGKFFIFWNINITIIHSIALFDIIYFTIACRREKTSTFFNFIYTFNVAFHS